MLSIKEITSSEISLIKKLTNNIWPQTYASILPQEQIEYMMEMMYSEESLKAQFGEGCRYIVIYNDEDPIGYASFRKANSTTYKLDKIYIFLDQQGKGIGRFVMSYIIEEIKNDGAGYLQLQVNRNNVKAKSFYEKMGFEVIHEDDFDIGNGYFMNDYIMEKKF